MISLLLLWIFPIAYAQNPYVMDSKISYDEYVTSVEKMKGVPFLQVWLKALNEDVTQPQWIDDCLKNVDETARSCSELLKQSLSERQNSDTLRTLNFYAEKLSQSQKTNPVFADKIEKYLGNFEQTHASTYEATTIELFLKIYQVPQQQLVILRNGKQIQSANDLGQRGLLSHWQVVSHRFAPIVVWGTLEDLLERASEKRPWVSSHCKERPVFDSTINVGTNVSAVHPDSCYTSLNGQFYSEQQTELSAPPQLRIQSQTTNRKSWWVGAGVIGAVALIYFLKDKHVTIEF